MIHPEVERIKKELESRKPAWERKEQVIKEKNIETSATIRMLESRLDTQWFEVALDNDTKVGIRSNLSMEEVRRLGEIFEARGEIRKEIESIKEDDEDKSHKIVAYETIFDNLWLEIIEMITVDPKITFDFLKNNGDMYSKEDTLVMFLAYKEGQLKIAEERQERVKKAISFRGDTTR